MEALRNQIIAVLQSDDDDMEVYPSFDSIPVSQKSKTLFTVVSMQTFQLGQPFPDGQSGIAPFTADFQVSLLAPMTTKESELMEVFYTVILPRMQLSGCMLYSTTLHTPEIDLKLQKLVYHAVFRLRGLYLPDMYTASDTESTAEQEAET